MQPQSKTSFHSYMTLKRRKTSEEPLALVSEIVTAQNYFNPEVKLHLSRESAGMVE